MLSVRKDNATITIGPHPPNDLLHPNTIQAKIPTKTHQSIQIYFILSQIEEI